MVKESNIFIGLKKTCLGVLDRGNRNKDNETGLKKGGGIEMSTTVLHSRAAPSLEYLPAAASTFTTVKNFKRKKMKYVSTVKYLKFK